MTLADVLDQIERSGLLLLSDPALPSLVALVAGGPVKGSWWGHARGHEIYALSEQLAEHPDVLVLKLVAGKVTFLHRKLWPALLAVAASGEPWQKEGLSSSATRLLDLVADRGEVKLADPGLLQGVTTRELGQAAKQLEERLLAHARSVHTERGAHAKVLEAWPRCAARRGASLDGLTPRAGRARLEQAVLALVSVASSLLPWQRAARTTKPREPGAARRS